MGRAFNASVGTQRSGGAAGRSTRESIRSVRKQVSAALRSVKNALPAAAEMAMQPIFDESQRLVPVLTGELKESGFLEVSGELGTVRVSIGYARGGKPDYAVFVHEMVDLKHKAPTQAKFLQQPLEEQIDEIAPRMAAAMKALTGF